ncbi:MAG: GNAT family N-acetyltransferase [Rhizobiales bacterium]|nr:GNAT family N-acetyltransferase [Hyphomicrobiales bacterium]
MPRRSRVAPCGLPPTSASIRTKTSSSKASKVTSEPTYDIGIRPVTASDLPVLAEWIARPHWQQWWGDPAEEVAHIREMIEGRDSTRPFIFAIDGRDVGYIQVWSIADQIDAGWTVSEPWLSLVPAEAVGVDLSIADTADLGRGIGSAALVDFVAMLRAEGHTTVLIDPDPENLRAVRAYRKAGFAPIASLEGRTSGVLIMQHVPTASPA